MFSGTQKYNAIPINRKIAPIETNGNQIQNQLDGNRKINEVGTTNNEIPMNKRVKPIFLVKFVGFIATSFKLNISGIKPQIKRSNPIPLIPNVKFPKIKFSIYGEIKINITPRTINKIPL